MSSNNGNQMILRALIDLRDVTIQKARIQFSNRIDAIERGNDNGTYRHYIERILQKFEELEEDITASLCDFYDEMPIVERMIKVKGVGKVLGLKVASMIDIRRADTVSALWRYAGYGVVDGKAERPRKGEKLHYNKRLKTTCYLIGQSFLRSNSPYRRIYDVEKAKYESREGWTKMHSHLAAMRKMIKLWLSHLWLVWREMEGLPTSAPYIAADPHHTIIEPWEMGWGEEKSEPTNSRKPISKSEPTPKRKEETDPKSHRT